MAEIAALRAQLPVAEEEASGSGMMLQKYLDYMTTYAETSYAVSVPESDSEPEEYDDLGPFDSRTSSIHHECQKARAR